MGSIKAGLVLRDASAITLDPLHPWARTVYIHDGRIYKVSSKDIDPSLTVGARQVIDCRGRAVIPAFHDAHCHVTAYA